MSDTLAFQRAPLQFLAERKDKLGDIFQFRLLSSPMVFLNHPDYVHRVLQENHMNYDKNVFAFRIMEALLGDSLVLMADNARWLKQRRLMQPSFHKERIAGFAAIMADMTEATIKQWEATYVQRGEEFEIWHEMGNLALSIVCKSLFSVETRSIEYDVIPAFKQTAAFLGKYVSMPLFPLKFPLPSHRRFWRIIEKLDSAIYSIIRQRRESSQERPDLLGMLLAAVDDEGKGMNDQQLRDEVMTLVFAGHETTASALTWTWYLLSQHPDVEEKLHEEIDRALAGRTPTVDDISALPYTSMVIKETMRLYPPGWQSFRRAINDDNLGGYHVPANSFIFFSSFFLHRHPEFWEKPEEFYPEHFSPELEAKRSKRVYIPFNRGPRMCIGNTFATMEMQIAVAMIAQRYRIKVVPGQHLEPQPGVTLQPPDGGIKVVLEKRN